MGQLLDPWQHDRERRHEDEEGPSLVLLGLADASGVYDAHLLSEQGLHRSLMAKGFGILKDCQEDLQILWSFKAGLASACVSSCRSLMVRRRGW